MFHPLRIRPRSHLPYATVIVLVTMAAASVHAADAPLAPVWNKPSAEAKKLLRKSVKQGGVGAQEARRGLAIIAALEDDEAALLEYLKSLYATAPGSWQAAAYWPDFVEAARSQGKEAYITNAARAILGKRDAPPFLRASARKALGDELYRAGKNAEADTAWAALGYVRKWRVIGPFDNVSRSGFDHAFAPEQGIDFSKAYSGADGLTLRWRPLARVSRSGAAGIGSSLGDEQADVLYAATAVNAGEGGPVTLRFDADGATRLYLNGALVSRDVVYRGSQTSVTDPLAVPVTLRKGWNTLLVKLADDEERTALLRLRFTEAGGDAAKLLPADPAKASPSSAMTEPASAPEPEFTIVTQLKRRIAQAPDDIEARWRFGRALRVCGDHEGAIAALKEAVGRGPESAVLHWELSQALSDDGQEDEARAERTLALQRDRRIVAAQLDREAEEAKGATASDRIKRLKALLSEINPNSPSLLWALASAYDDADLSADALRFARRAADAAPGEENLSGLFHWYIASDRNAEARATLAATLRRYPNAETLLTARAEQLAEQGNTAGAVAIYQRLLGTDQPTTSYRSALAHLYAGTRAYPKAAAQLDAARRERPQDAYLCATAGDLQQEMGDKQAATALYREAIRLDPSRIALRDKLRLLSGEKPVVQMVPATHAAPLLEHLPKAKDFPGVSVVRVLDEGRMVVYPDYAQAMYSHEILTVLDAAAVQRYQRYPLGLSSGTANATVGTARIIKADGKVTDCRDQASGAFAAFPSLAPGDTIDLEYRVEDYPRHGLAGKFWSEWFFTQTNGLVKLSRFVLITPKDMSLSVRAHGGLADPVERDAGAWRIREWRAANLPVRKQEILAPAERDGGMWVDISSVRSWKEIVDWYQSLSRPRCIPDAVVRAKADELTKDAKTDEEKIRAIVNFVAQKIQYQTTPFRLSAFVPTEGKQVLRENYGDCKDKAALVTAMLQHVGVKCHMALVSPRSFGITPLLPGPRFAHAIAVVETASGPLWVDATADTMEFGTLPSEDQGVPALPIVDDATDLVTTPTLPAERSEVAETIEGTLDEKGALSAKTQITARGNFGWLLRSVLRTVPESGRDQAMRVVFSQQIANARIDGTTLTGLENPDDPVTMGCAFTVPDYAQPTDRLLLTHIPWSQGDAMGTGALVDSLRADAANRARDVEISPVRGKQVSRVRLTLPPGYHVRDLKPEVKGESPFGTYRFAYTITGGTLTAEREFVLTPLRIPANDFAAYMTFQDEVAKQAKAPLILEKGP